MNRSRSLSKALLGCSMLAASAVSAQDPGVPWDAVGAALGARAVQTGATYRYAFPRTDLTVRIGDVTVEPAIALGSWAGFGVMGGDTVVMGDLVVTTGELGPVLQQLATDGIAVRAIHNHLVGEEPRITYVHYEGRGAALELARKVARALDRTGAPRPVPAAGERPVTIDTALAFRALGARGRAHGSVAQLGFNFVSAPVTIDGQPVPAALAYGSPVNLQAVSAGRWVATGDFAVPGPKVDAILDALATHGIVATAVHGHLIGESPTLYYIHFWADGAPGEVLRGLRAAIDAAR